MTQEDKELLLKDLCARLPYGVKVQVCNLKYSPIVKGVLNDEVFIQFNFTKPIQNGNSTYNIVEDKVKPYLRPISSMTEDEKNDLLKCVLGGDAKLFRVDKNGSIQSGTPEITSIDRFQLCYINFDCANTANYIDWLNAHHFDFRNLIERGLAIDCTDLNIY